MKDFLKNGLIIARKVVSRHIEFCTEYSIQLE
jgi:hypothetical protein